MKPEEIIDDYKECIEAQDGLIEGLILSNDTLEEENKQLKQQITHILKLIDESRNWESTCAGEALHVLHQKMDGINSSLSKE